MTRQQILDLYFMDARAKLIDLAAFLDRVVSRMIWVALLDSRTAQPMVTITDGWPEQERLTVLR